MPDTPLSLFISYSRTDSPFVDRLEADLRARSFQPWVDRRKLEGGQDFMDELQNAIDRSQILLVVLSPKAMESPYVKIEFRYAFSQGKPIIPLNVQTTKVPMDLNGLQWVNFQNGYDQGFADLQIALSRQEIAALPPPAKPRSSISIAINQPEPALVTPQPAPPPPAADLNELYRAGVAARSQGNLERTAIFWQQVLDRDRSFGNNTLAPQMQRLMAELRPLRVQRLREQAEQAHRAGVWGQEIGAWQALLGLEPMDTQAQQRLPVAQHNQQYAWMYENAQEFAKAKDIPALKEQLGLLWQNAPYYGDPAGLARLAGITKPPTLQETMNAQQRAISTTVRKQQRNEFLMGESRALKTARPAIWFSAFCLLSGVGATVGILTQSWPWAIGVVASVALLSYLLGYHRAVGFFGMSINVLIYGVLVFVITWFLSTFQYDQSQTSHLWFGVVCTVTLRHQIIFGVILGAIAGAIIGIGLIADTLDNLENFDEEEMIVSLLFIGGTLIVWFIVAILGSIFNWGFGLGFGWGIALLAGIPSALIGMAGIIASGYICWVALRNSPGQIHSRVIARAHREAEEKARRGY